MLHLPFLNLLHLVFGDPAGSHTGISWWRPCSLQVELWYMCRSLCVCGGGMGRSKQFERQGSLHRAGQYTREFALHIFFLIPSYRAQSVLCGHSFSSSSILQEEQIIYKSVQELHRADLHSKDIQRVFLCVAGTFKDACQSPSSHRSGHVRPGMHCLGCSEASDGWLCDQSTL